jgi:phage baseplate assembly protein W
MDCYHYFGNDLSVASNGDILLTDGITLSQQRILRRLLTNPGDYIWELTYGAGLPQFVGQPLSQSLLTQINRKCI